MAYSKFLLFMKNFDLFNQQVTKENVALIYARRCPNKIIDFAAFVDLLFKISKYQPFPKGYHVSGETKFQVYLENSIFNKHNAHLIGKNHEHKTPRFPLFKNTNKEEEVAMILLEQSNPLINHVRILIVCLHSSNNKFRSSVYMNLLIFNSTINQLYSSKISKNSAMITP